MESQVSTTAKHILISYLEKMAAPHKEAIVSIKQSVKETVESMIAEKSDIVANIAVTVVSSAADMQVSINAELNAFSGCASLFIGKGGKMTGYCYGETEGAALCDKISKGLQADADFQAFAVDAGNQFHSEWLTMFHFEQSAYQIKKSMQD